MESKPEPLFNFPTNNPQEPADDVIFSDEDDEQQNPDNNPDEPYLSVNIGDVFNDRYTVIRKLGWGTFSTVWLCSDRQDTRFKALKIARCGTVITKTVTNEIELLDCVQNNTEQTPLPHQGKIVRLLENFTISAPDDTTHICLVFEILGPNLGKLLRKFAPDGFPLPIVKSMMRQVLEGLDFLHTKCNIIHADIKPANICVGVDEARKLIDRRAEPVEELSVVITDLGSACWESYHFSDLIQTCCYRCPEVLLGCEYGTTADIWSAACTAFELATGRLLFMPHTNYDLTEAEEDEAHLARIVRLFGDIPTEMVFGCEVWEEMFTREGKLLHYGEAEPLELAEMLTRGYFWNDDEALAFADFLAPMFVVRPNDRCSARDALQHPWLQV